MKSKVIFMIGVMMCVTLFAPCYVNASVSKHVNDSNKPVIMPMAEVTKWIYREYNSIKQKRLWSVTYSRWITNWINY